MQKLIRRIKREGLWRVSIQGASKDHSSLIIRVLLNELKSSSRVARQNQAKDDLITNFLYKYDIESNVCICLLENYDEKVIS